MPLLDDALDDYPKSEIWRLQTDGNQATQGPNNFRENFYLGMNAGFEFINQNSNEQITPELIEGIYRSAYSYEDEYESEEILQKGYNEALGGFEIFLPVPGLENSAGVSEAGLDELIEALLTAKNNQGSRQWPQYGIRAQIIFSPSIWFNPNDYESREEFKAVLLDHLRNASGSKDDCKGEKTPEDQLTIVELVSYVASREEILHWVQDDIDNYQIELSGAKEIENPEQRKIAEVNAINHFIRKLHQSHYFPDGNGRTFVFLLSNLLLLQNGHGMKITENPAHYAAYSTDELLEETLHDLDHFNEYKITRAKEFLMDHDAETINMSPKLVKNELMNQLSTDPLIAMAQINELHAQVLSNKIVVPQNYAPNPRGFFSFLQQKTPPALKSAHNHILNLLKNAYVDKLQELVEQAPSVDEHQQIGYGSQDTPGDVLQTMLEKHNITNFIAADTISDLIESYNHTVTVQETHTI